MNKNQRAIMHIRGLIQLRNSSIILGNGYNLYTYYHVNGVWYFNSTNEINLKIKQIYESRLK